MSSILGALSIACGDTTPDPISQAVIKAATLLHDLTTGEDHKAGCGDLVLWWESYRCVDCDKFFHKKCIKEHFANTETVPT